MRQEIDAGLPEPRQPFAWAIRSGGLLFTTHGPVQPDGTILQAGIREQARLALENLRRTMERAGGGLEGVVQATIYLLDAADMAPVDEVYREFFCPPYPNRASVVVAGLVAPGMRFEIQAIAALPG